MNYNKLKKKEIQQLLDEEKIDYNSKMLKAELIDLLKNSQNENKMVEEFIVQFAEEFCDRKFKDSIRIIPRSVSDLLTTELNKLEVVTRDMISLACSVAELYILIFEWKNITSFDSDMELFELEDSTTVSLDEIKAIIKELLKKDDSELNIPLENMLETFNIFQTYKYVLGYDSFVYANYKQYSLHVDGVDSYYTKMLITEISTITHCLKTGAKIDPLTFKGYNTPKKRGVEYFNNHVEWSDFNPVFIDKDVESLDDTFVFFKSATGIELEDVITEIQTDSNHDNSSQPSQGMGVYGEKPVPTEFTDDEIINFKSKNNKALVLNEIIGESLKESASYIVQHYKNFEKLQDAGVTPINGAIFYGPPGTGKTVLATSISKEVNGYLIDFDLSEMKGKYIGESEAKLKGMMTRVLTLRKKLDLRGEQDSPIILFMDEGDSFKSRDSEGTHESTQSQINMMLKFVEELKDLNVLSILCTNHINQLDSAMVRPGRFDYEVKFGHINYKEAIEMIDLLFPEVNEFEDKKDVLVLFLSGKTKANISSSINFIKAHLVLNNMDIKDISTGDLLDLAETKTIGNKSSIIMKDDELTRTAYHELGHGYFNALEEKSGIMSIIPRNTRDVDFLGYAQNTGDESYESITSDKLRHDIRRLLAGQVAEEVFVGNISTGNHNDIQKVFRMLKHYLPLLDTNVLIHFETKKDELISEDIRKYIETETQAVKAEFEREEVQDIFNEYAKILKDKKALFGKEINKFQNKVLKIKKED